MLRPRQLNQTSTVKPYLFLLLTLSASSITAEEIKDFGRDRLNSSPRHADWVDLQSSGDRKIKAFVVYPERKDKAPVVIVISEIFGLTDWVRGVCDQLESRRTRESIS